MCLQMFVLIFETKGICRLINKLPLLKYLDVNRCIQISNPMLETAFSTGQTIQIFCKKTSVDTFEFNSKHKEIEVFDFDSSKFVCQQLTFYSYEMQKQHVN